jgi:hypothetical protein
MTVESTIESLDRCLRVTEKSKKLQSVWRKVYEVFVHVLQNIVKFP